MYRDMQDIRGLAYEKRASLIAAAGRHDVLLVGPPGAGKTMLAMRLPSILPPPLPDAVDGEQVLRTKHLDEALALAGGAGAEESRN